MQDIQSQLEQCLAKFRAGNLTDQDLQAALDHVSRPCQKILYLQAHHTAITSRVEGMVMIDENGVDEGPDDPNDWPYQTVLDAMRDGWRIIKFPEMALMMIGDQEETYGLGCEFILEK